jgi:TPR repeat protein
MKTKQSRPVPASLMTLAILPALLALQPAAAQTPAAAPVAAANAVVINGRRLTDNGPIMVNLGDSAILNGRSASSCGFMEPYDYRLGDYYGNYMVDFGGMNSLSSGLPSFSAVAPYGDASNMDELRAGFGLGTRRGDRDGFSRGGCSSADLRFAAGRAHILARDKSLSQGFAAFRRGDYAQALEQFDVAWNKIGYPEAALVLAQMSQYGIGKPQDTKAALYWYDRLAGGRFEWPRFDPRAPYDMTPKVQATMALANMYEHGDGAPVDHKEARRWLQKAADMGYMPALDMLGGALLDGTHGERDPAKGIAMLKKAGHAGFLPAAYHVGRAYYNGDSVERDLKQAAEWFAAAARAGYPAAMFAYGHMLDLGEGAPADPARALVLYKDAALKGDRDAQFALGTYFYTGEVVGKRDAVTARKWFEQAAKQGQPDAMFNLGAMMSTGEGGPKDAALAYVWLNLASQSGYDGAGDAMRALGAHLGTADRSRADAILTGPARR